MAITPIVPNTGGGDPSDPNEAYNKMLAEARIAYANAQIIQAFNINVNLTMNLLRLNGELCKGFASIN